jgi:predicted transcriptional regulator of viral defense system
MDSRSLSQTEARVVLSLEEDKLEVVTLDELRIRAGVSPGFARKLAHELVKKGWLQRLRRGTYLLNPTQHGPDAVPDTDPFRIGTRLVEPYYLGFATAAELQGLLPQASSVYYVVTTQRAGPTGDASIRFKYVRVTPGRFFGTREMVRRGVRLSISDLERTVIDCLNRPDFAGGMAGVSHIIALSKPNLNWSRLGRYLDQLGNRSLVRRAGFLLERIRPSVKPPGSWTSERRARESDSYAPLGPPKMYGRRGARDNRWHVILNVTNAQLFSEGEFR